MIWLSGLRGAVAYALSLESYYDFHKGNGDVILLLSIIIAQFTIIGLSTILYPIIGCLNVQSNGLEDNKINSIKNSGLITKVKILLEKFHNKILMPVFSGVSDSKGIIRNNIS